MSVVSAARKYTSLQTQATKRMSDAAEVQTAGWDNDVDLGDGGVNAAQATIFELNHQKIIVNFSAMMAYLRLYQMPDDEVPEEYPATTMLIQEGSTQCVCCGLVSGIDEVGFCAACVKAAE